VEKIVDRILKFKTEQTKDFIYLIEEACVAEDDKVVSEIKQTLVEMIYPECLGDVVVLEDK